MFTNIHPLLVHFPIAFLGLYAVTEIARFKFLTRQPYWFYVRATLVIAGAAMVWPTIIAGGLMEEQFKGTSLQKVIDVHSSFGAFTGLLFSIIGAAYILEWYRLMKSSANANGYRPSVLVRIGSWLVNSKLIILLALIGLVTITITGALGASMVYGPNSDPFVKIIYQAFIHG